MIFTSSCTTVSNHVVPKKELPKIRPLLVTELARVEPPEKRPVVAVYGVAFNDDTGQRRSNGEFANFSTAVTQSPVTYLIRALHHAGGQKQGFFDVVERVGVDNLMKERQIIRATRQEASEKQKIKPLLFAGLLMQGSVVGYESNEAFLATVRLLIILLSKTKNTVEKILLKKKSSLWLKKRSARSIIVR